MKKILAILLAFVLVCSMGFVLSFAEEEEVPEVDLFETDEQHVNVFTYEGEVHANQWFNKFNADDQCTGTNYTIFNAAVPFTRFLLSTFWAGKSENDQDCDVQIQLFAFDTDYKTTVGKTPVFDSGLIHLDGDQKGFILDFGAAIPANQYVLQISQVGDKGSHEMGRYCVLPTVDEVLFDPTYVDYGAMGTFGFGITFEKSEAGKYFAPMKGKENLDIKVKGEKTVIPRDGNNPREINSIPEYGILTPVIPDGQVLYSFSLAAACTWNNANGDSDLYYEVFKWKGDYDSTYSGKAVCSGEILDHKDNSDLKMVFDTNLRYGNRYLIVLSASNEGKIGYWGGLEDKVPEGWEFFDNDEEAMTVPSCKAAYAEVGDLGPEPTDEPTAAPTDTPEPTAAPTDAPATDVPETAAPTDAPATDEPADEKKGCGNVIVSGAALLTVLAAAAVIRKKH